MMIFAWYAVYFATYKFVIGIGDQDAIPQQHTNRLKTNWCSRVNVEKCSSPNLSRRGWFYPGDTNRLTIMSLRSEIIYEKLATMERSKIFCTVFRPPQCFGAKMEGHEQWCV